MKTLLYIILVLTSCAATAQTRLSRVRSSLLGRRSMQQQELEKPLPFEEAIEKAKVGNPQGYYSLAVHLMRGDEIERDQDKAVRLFAMASNRDYPNAVFVSTLFKDPTTPPVREYIGSIGILYLSSRNNLTNETLLAEVRAGYNRAFSLGVLVATNELSRFEAKLKEADQEREAKKSIENRKLENAKLLSAIKIEASTMTRREKNKALKHKQESELAKENRDRLAKTSKEFGYAFEDRQDYSIHFDSEKMPPFVWEAGNGKGLLLDVLIRANYYTPCFQRATLTIDKNGVIKKVEGCKWGELTSQ